MSKWKVEPAGVADVIGKVETEAKRLTQVASDFESVKGQSSSIEVQGRSVMSSAFESFCGAREEVPGKLMYVLQQRCMQVATATMELAGGAEEMADLTTELQSVSEQTWSQHETQVCRAGDANPYATPNNGGFAFDPNGPVSLPPSNSPTTPLWAPPGDVNNAISTPLGAYPTNSQYASPLLAPTPGGANPNFIGPPSPTQTQSHPFVYQPPVPGTDANLLPGKD